MDLHRRNPGSKTLEETVDDAGFAGMVDRDDDRGPRKSHRARDRLPASRLHPGSAGWRHCCISTPMSRPGHRAYVRHRRLARPVRGRRDGGRPRWLSVLLVLRRSQPRPRRPFWLPATSLLAALAFICSNWIIYWDRLQDRLVPVRTAGGRLRDLCVYHHAIAQAGCRVRLALHRLAAALVRRHVGAFAAGRYRRRPWLARFLAPVACVAVWSLIVIALAMHSTLPAEDTAEMMLRMERMS
jgi:hypothetical protein